MLNQQKIFAFWLPLALSALLMSVEGPWIQAVISRSPDAALHLAAFGQVVVLSVTIEAPVIMLLATSSALSRHQQAFRVLWRFMMVLNAVLTVIAGLFAFTPLLDVYLGSLLGIPRDIVEAARPGMVIMILWTAFIGYRRFYQGVLIRQGQTRTIGYGTLVRVVVSGGVALGLGGLTGMPGTQTGAFALVLAVGAEAIYAWYVSRPEVEKVRRTPLPPGARLLTYRAALRFHVPLALTSLLTLLVRPVIDSGLATLPDAKLALAAFPVIFSIVLLLRSGGFAWQEVVIALNRGKAQMQALDRFTWLLGWSSTGFMVLFAFTPLIDVYSQVILSVPEALRPAVVIGTRVAVLIPLLTTLQSYWRALLMLTDTTAPVYQAMIAGFVATGATMWAGLHLGIHGIIVASLALSLGGVVELVYLWRAFRPHSTKLQLRWQQEAVLAGD